MRVAGRIEASLIARSRAPVARLGRSGVAAGQVSLSRKARRSRFAASGRSIGIAREAPSTVWTSTSPRRSRKVSALRVASPGSASEHQGHDHGNARTYLPEKATASTARATASTARASGTATAAAAAVTARPRTRTATAPSTS